MQLRFLKLNTMLTNAFNGNEKLKDHHIDYCSTGVIIVVDNNDNFHRYLGNESVSFIIFAFLDVFSSI